MQDARYAKKSFHGFNPFLKNRAKHVIFPSILKEVFTYVASFHGGGDLELSLDRWNGVLVHQVDHVILNGLS